MMRDESAKHSAIYFVGRLLPSALTILATAVFTRMADPTNYASYVLLVSGAQIGSALFFQWIRLSFLRYAQEDSRAEITGTALGLYAIQGVIASSSIFLLAPAFGISDNRILVIGSLLLLAQAWFDFIQEVQRGSLKPVHYSITFTLRTTFILILGALALHFSGSGYILAISTIVAILISTLWNAPKLLAGIRWDTSLAKKVLRYGWPLSFSMVLFSISTTGDKFIVNHVLGSYEAGLYGPISDFGRQTITTFLQSITLAAYPLALRALKSHGPEAARLQMGKNIELLLLVAVPCTIGVMVAAEECAFVMLGLEYRSAAAQLLPLCAGASFFMSLQMFYFTQATQLGERTGWQLSIMVATAASSLIACMLLIPRLGLVGAGWAALIAQAVGLAVSVVASRNCFPLPFPALQAAKIISGGVLMGACVIAVKSAFDGPGALEVVAVFGAGAVSYVAFIFILDIQSVRSRVASKFKARAHQSHKRTS